jgi:hypothetical protein
MGAQAGQFHIPHTLRKDSFLASGSCLAIHLIVIAIVFIDQNSNQKYLCSVLGKRRYDNTASTESKKEESAKLGLDGSALVPDDFACPANLELLPGCCTYIH